MASTLNSRPQAAGGSIRFLSWNIKGINGPVKRARIFAHLKHLNTDIAFLQETHLTMKDQVRLKKSWVGQVFHSKFNSKTRGTAILIHKKIQFKAVDVISDPQGRYIMVSGSLSHTPVLLANIYAPNWDDKGFIDRIISSLPNLTSHRLILGGDMNCVMDPTLDRSSSKQRPPSRMAKALSMFMKQVGCIDPWRFLYPTSKEYSFFSHVHQTYSRIDYFFIDGPLLPSVKNVEYSAIVESDHAPLILDLSFALFHNTRSPWRLNSTLLGDECFCKMVSTAIDNYIETNKTDSISPKLLWETLKAVIRGEIISYCSLQNKLRRQKQEQLIQSILELDRKYSTSPSPELYKERLGLQSQYDLISTSRTEQLLLRSRGYMYEHGEKAGRLLAHQLKCKSASQHISQIRTPNRNLTVIPAEINKTFETFYSDLYSSESPKDNTDMLKFLNDLEFPTISHTQKGELDEPLLLQEIIDSIRSVQSGKAPGPDGYPGEFYKKFSDKLAPLLLDMFNEALDRGSLPQTLTEASITLLLKPGKDASDCGSYRPISLLNADYKILAKALSSRLEPVMPDIISPDQTGFIRNRHSFANVRRLLDVMYSPASVEVPEVVISLDAEKAFDRVEWGYLSEVLKKFGFGPKFVSWIMLLYSSPKASVMTNKMRSQYFALSRGARQGCPASPLLFALAIEPISIFLKASPHIQGIHRWGTEHRLSLYADDMLLYVSDPVSCVPTIIESLHRFGTFSGYKLNLSKSECFPVNDLALLIPNNHLPFHMSRSGFKYLGINVSRTLSSLFGNNIVPLVDKLKLDFQRWGSIYMSMAGRVNCVKMNVLPRFLYLFQCLPIFLPKSFFQSTNKLISSFVWGGKNPRIRKEFLQRHRSEGGLALPNFRYYYWAANIQKVVLWIQTPETDWCQNEANSCISTSLLALVTSRLPLSPARYSSNPIVVSTLRIWAQFRLHFGLRGLSSLSPICNNHLFAPAGQDSAFSFWQRAGLTNIKDLYIDGVFATFEDLSKKFNFPRSHLFRYFQVRHFVQSHNPTFPNMPPRFGLDSILETPSGLKGHISRIFDMIVSFKDSPLIKIKVDWEGELGEGISDEIWDQAAARVNGSSSCTRLGLIQFKVFHRLHYSKKRLSKIYPNVDETCDRCHNAPADLTHMFWSCPCLVDYWTIIFRSLSEALDIDLKPNVWTAIFGVTSIDRPVRNKLKDNIAFASLLARRRLLLDWKSQHPPKASLWLRDLMMFLKLEKIKYTMRGSSSKFQSNWGSVISYFDKLKTLPEVP